MTRWALFLALVAIDVIAQTKSLPNQAGNAKLGLRGTVITDRNAVTSLLGVDLGEGYIVVQMKATPQTPTPLRMSIDDFTLVSRKNGEKSGALAPNAIVGSSRLIVATTTRGGGGIGSTNGMGMPMPPRNSGIGNVGGTESGVAEARIETSKGPEDPRMAVLESKVFPEIETKDPVEGLLYFNLEGKLQPKDLGLIYAGRAGRLVIDFK